MVSDSSGVGLFNTVQYRQYRLDSSSLSLSIRVVADSISSHSCDVPSPPNNSNATIDTYTNS
jgi:hypothetical protein